jgi:alanine racemase
VRIHAKLDTGMGRLGTRSPTDALAVAAAVAGAGPTLELAAVMTHFATADDDPEFLEVQRERFSSFVAELRASRPGLRAHAANSAATLRDPASHFDMVRCGIAIYGCDPMHVDPRAWGLEPALELSSYVAAVKRAAPGDSAGYGRRFIAERETWLATVPIGYADGIRRALTNNCEVIVGARRYPLVGTVSMDNLTLDLGPETDVRPGETAIVLGGRDGVRQTAEDLARRIGTISYEVLCGISRRVPRAYHHDGEPG